MPHIIYSRGGEPAARLSFKCGPSVHTAHVMLGLPYVLLFYDFGILNSENMSKRSYAAQTTACRRDDLFFSFSLDFGRKIKLLRT